MKCQGDRSVVRGRHQATAVLVVFARRPKPQAPHLLPCTTCILGFGNLHRTNPDYQRVGSKEESSSKRGLGREGQTYDFKMIQIKLGKE